LVSGRVLGCWWLGEGCWRVCRPLFPGPEASGGAVRFRVPIPEASLQWRFLDGESLPTIGFHKKVGYGKIPFVFHTQRRLPPVLWG